MVLKTLIVDDEPIARRILREELDRMDHVDVVGEAQDGPAALAAVRELAPDLVLLDLQMPGMGGFDVIRGIDRGDHLPVIVIVTAFDQHAVEAFEAGAVDYLLKPVTRERLAQTVERALKPRARPDAAAELIERLGTIAHAPFLRTPGKIVAKAGDEYLLLNADEVYAFAAEGDLVWIITERKRYLATQPLKVIQEKLRNTSFHRIHRNALVNIDHVRKMSTLTSRRWLVTLDNNQEFIVSRRQVHSVRRLLSW